MYARVSIYELPEDRVNEAAERFGEAIAQIAVLPGLVDAYFLVSHESRRGISVVLWSGAQEMAASRVTTSRLRTEAAREVGANIVSVEEFDVAAHAFLAPAGVV